MKINALKFWNGFLLSTVLWFVGVVILYFTWYESYKTSCDIAIPAYLEKVQRENPILYLKGLLSSQ